METDQSIELGKVSVSRREQVTSLREAGLTYAEIGRRLGLSKQRVGQIVKAEPGRQKPDLQSKVMLTTTEAAQLLGLHPNTVRHWCQQGLLKPYRISRRGDRRFRREDIDDFLLDRQ